ncbi:extracellular solute-binding protein [Ignavigranum ruoffiae]|uniref:extracellular solute-binding protein n=1 Tax=Ignavigranum ruoffiae TaxID=89093 RepID=UPI00206B93C3|nr:extracellular solute-binding protein [Ignavigranum ruoffiae]UPQ85039.1 extracellular solute-binding protein [Ignavigranum ruoffiae]
MFKKVILSSLVTLGAISNILSLQNVEATSDKSETIVIYSNAVSDGRGDYFKEKAKEAGFTIEFVDLGGTDLINRLVAEKNKPVADIVFGLNEMNFDTLRQEDLLEPYEPVWLGEIDPEIKVAEDHLHSPVDIARVFPIYNADLIKDEADIPKDWSSFYKEEKFHGKYKVQNKLGGATDTAAMYIHFNNYQDDNADMGVSEEGLANLEEWFANGYQTPEGEDWVQNFVDGKVPYAYTFMANVGNIEKEHGIDVGVINPESGVIQTVEQIGIVKDGEENTVEQEFVDWFGSEEVMAGFAEGYNQMPVNKKAQESVLTP